jgi:hypothetical protein
LLYWLRGILSGAEEICSPNPNASGIVIDSTGRLLSKGGFGQIRSIFLARQIQFALKLAF